MTAICPCCGYDLVAAETTTIGDLTFNPARGVAVRGDRLAVHPKVHEILGALMRAYPEPLRQSVLEERLGYEGVGKIIPVHVCRLRAALRRVDAAFHVDTVFGFGYRLVATR